MKNVIHYTKPDDCESKCRFFVQNESIRDSNRFESIRIANRNALRLEQRRDNENDTDKTRRNVHPLEMQIVAESPYVSCNQCLKLVSLKTRCKGDKSNIENNADHF